MEKKTGLIVAVICVIIISSIVVWLKNDKLIDGKYESLTITKMGNTIEVITDKKEIEKIIDHINNSPRMFQYDSGMTYDYMEHGFLIFKNGGERVQLAFIMPRGNVITKYWEIKTEFGFVMDIK